MGNRYELSSGSFKEGLAIV